jgi:hypothetical protein
MTDILIDRFEQYFRHPDWDHDVLRLGDLGVACRNVRRAIAMLGVNVEQHPSDDLLFDAALKSGVRDFQEKFRHSVTDGAVGPGTRRFLISNLIGRFAPNTFVHFDRPDPRLSVFLSYASGDVERVNKLDQWLRDKGIRVIRDTADFIAGTNIPENIRRSVAQSDKVVVVFSVNSSDRDWPGFERAVAEGIELRIKKSVLIYVRLDDTPLPAHDPLRLAITTMDYPEIVSLFREKGVEGSIHCCAEGAGGAIRDTESLQNG